ncbi:MAG: ATP-binding protein [Deltaproteobacteria bacterium]|nr:ATP-binding protein [Deltaproteobacteria bacterium]
MDFSDFRSRAIAEGKRYGKDEYVFVREFAQNSRDAGASRISIDTLYQNGVLNIVFTDNGEGMAFAHARRYLFTLYASSKEKEAASAGQFGVGFWSVLLFSPERIVIYSRTAKENWGVEFNQYLDREQPVRSLLQHRGTQVIACKSFDKADADACVSSLEHALRRYCRFLRRNNRSAGPLSVLLNGKRIDGPMELSGECAATFSYKDVQGAVALGKTPRVNLYVRGLPVWSGTSLTELQYGATPEAPVSYPQGLAPVYLLNGNRLSVTLDRRSVFDDAALQRTRRIAGREMRKLVAGYLDHIAPAGIWGRVEYFFSAFFDDFHFIFMKRLLPVFPVVLAVLAVVLGGWLLFPEVFQSILGGTSSDVTPLAAGTYYSGGVGLTQAYEQATTDTGVGDSLNMKYAPAGQTVYFRLQVVEQLHVDSGAKSGPLTPYRRPAPFRCRQKCVGVSLALDEGVGVYHLPVPTGHYIDLESVVLSEGVDGEILRSQKDDWLFVMRRRNNGGYIQYRSGWVTANLRDSQRWLYYPRVTFPSLYISALERAKKLPSVSQKAQLLSSVVEDAIVYDTAADTVMRYHNFFNSDSGGNWYQFVFSINKGDCDVKNIILLNLLRRLNIPSRLAVGYVGNRGEVEKGKHAWVEYYENGWKVEDATGEAPAGTVSLPAVGMPNGAADVIPQENAVLPKSSVRSASQEATANSSVEALRQAKEQRSDDLADTVLFWVATAMGILFAAGIVWVLLRFFRAPMPTPSNKQETLAAQMLQAALENSSMNIRGSGLLSRAILPTWNGHRISMKQAMKLARREKLYYSSRSNFVTDALVSRKYTVVRTENAAFAPVISRIAGSVNLEEVGALCPISLSELHQVTDAAGEVLGHTIALASATGLSSRFIVPCKGLTGMLIREFDLSRLPVSWNDGIPNRFIAVATDDDEPWRALISLAGGVEDAAILLLDRIISHSWFLHNVRPRLRHRLALLANRRPVTKDDAAEIRAKGL